MTSYNDLVNFEIGNQSNYGSQFKLSRLESIAAINILKLTGKKRKTSKVMRVYIAGSMGTGNTHLDKFTTASSSLLSNGWSIEYLYLKEVRKMEDWIHPSFLVDWLEESDYHVILCQGIHNGMLGVWKPIDCQREILRLQSHNGFPNGLQLKDPVLTADKFEYLCAVADICLPTFKFPLVHSNAKLNQILVSLKQFLDKYKHYDSDEDQDFIIKAPYVQNQQGFTMRHFGTYDKFMAILRNIYKQGNASINKRNVRCIDVFPYMIVQPRIGCTNESKIILFNGEAQFVCKSNKRITCIKDSQILKDFAESAWLKLKERTKGSFLCNGLTRVDLFCTKTGELKVNEFESLDANYSTSESQESQTAELIKEYYVNILSKLSN